MTIEEEVRAYLAGITRRSELQRIEAMCARPSLYHLRQVRPRIGFFGRLLDFIFKRRK